MYNLTQCRTPTWPPFCPFQIVEALVPCEIWRCTGEPPDPEPFPPGPAPLPPGPAPNIHTNPMPIIGGIFGFFILIGLMFLGIFFKQVNLFIFLEFA